VVGYCELFLFFLLLKFPKTNVICATDKMHPQLHSKVTQNKIQYANIIEITKDNLMALPTGHNP